MEVLCYRNGPMAGVHDRLTSEIKTLAEVLRKRASCRAHYVTPLEDARHDFISRDVSRNCFESASNLTSAATLPKETTNL